MKTPASGESQRLLGRRYGGVTPGITIWGEIVRVERLQAAVGS